ncbi:retrovirus-related pol polyprotein from transposon TNT 1-94 [Tanacetum coccineum]
MAQEYYVEGCFMQRPPLLAPNGFCLLKARFETDVKSKDIDLWQIIQNGDFYFKVEDEETMLMKETPYKLLKDTKKKQLVKNEETKMTIYNALPRKEYERVFMCNTAKEVKSLALKSKVTREQTSDDNDSQGGSDENIDEEESQAFNLLARNFRKFFRKGNRFGRENRFGNSIHRLGKGRGNNFGNKGGESSKPKGACYNYGIEGRFASKCRKPKENKAFMGGSWSDSEDGEEQPNDATCLMAIDSQEVVSKTSSSNNDLNIIDLQKDNEELIKFSKYFAKTFEKLSNEKRSLEKENSKLSSKINDLEIEVKKLANDKEVVEPCKICVVLTKEVYDSGHVIFKSNLKVKVVGRGNITHDTIAITNVKHVSGIAIKLISVGHQGNANNRTRKEVSTNRILELLHLDLVGPYPIQSYGGNFYTLIIVDDYSNYTWIVFVNCKDDVLEKFKILCKKLENLHDCSVVSIITNHSSKFDKLQFRSFCEQHGMSYNLLGPFTSEPNEIVERTHRKLRNMSSVMILSTSKVYIMLNKETMRIDESLNVTFDESLPEPKSSSSAKDDRIDEPIVQDLSGSSSLQINVSDEGYPKSLK